MTIDHCHAYHINVFCKRNGEIKKEKKWFFWIANNSFIYFINLVAFIHSRGWELFGSFVFSAFICIHSHYLFICHIKQTYICNIRYHSFIIWSIVENSLQLIVNGLYFLMFADTPQISFCSTNDSINQDIIIQRIEFKRKN